MVVARKREIEIESAPQKNCSAGHAVVGAAVGSCCVALTVGSGCVALTAAGGACPATGPFTRTSMQLKKSFWLQQGVTDRPVILVPSREEKPKIL
jgi:hypothetical protein